MPRGGKKRGHEARTASTTHKEPLRMVLFAATYGRGIWRMSVKAWKEGTAETTLNVASVVK